MPCILDDHMSWLKEAKETITDHPQSDSRIVAGFKYHQWCYSCHVGVVPDLLQLLDFTDNPEHLET